MLSSWNLPWSSSKNVCLGWCLRCGYSVANYRATHSVSLLSCAPCILCKMLGFLCLVGVLRIQGVSRLVDITAGGDFLGLCDRKSSYKHVSDFGRLRSYRHFLIPVHALVWTASYGTSWRVIYATWWLIVCGSCNEQPSQFTTERQPVLRPAVAISKTSFKRRSVQIKGNFTKLTIHLYFKCIMYYAGLLFCLVYCQ